MKRLATFVFALLMVLSLVACGGQNVQTGSTVSPSVTNTKTPVPTSTPGGVATPTVNPEDTFVKPDILSLVFNDDGTVVNGVDGGPGIVQYGETIQIVKDEKTGNNMAKFDALEGNRFSSDISQYYDKMQNAYTLEVYFKVTDIPATAQKKYFDIIHDQLGNGWEIEFHRTKDESTFLMIDFMGRDLYKYDDAELDEWYHCVCVFDEFYFEIYINGDCVLEGDWMDDVEFDTTSGEFFSVGGKQDGYKVLNGFLGVCNLYTSVVNWDQIDAMYENLLTAFE